MKHAKIKRAVVFMIAGLYLMSGVVVAQDISLDGVKDLKQSYRWSLGLGLEAPKSNEIAWSEYARLFPQYAFMLDADTFHYRRMLGSGKRAHIYINRAKIQRINRFNFFKEKRSGFNVSLFNLVRKTDLACDCHLIASRYNEVLDSGQYLTQFLLHERAGITLGLSQHFYTNPERKFQFYTGVNGNVGLDLVSRLEYRYDLWRREGSFYSNIRFITIRQYQESSFTSGQFWLNAIVPIGLNMAVGKKGEYMQSRNELFLVYYQGVEMAIVPKLGPRIGGLSSIRFGINYQL